MPGDPKECRQHALTCVRFAQTSPSPQQRDHFANLARTWIRLAEDLERCQTFLNTLVMRPNWKGERANKKSDAEWQLLHWPSFNPR
jgi:hypothetical protein